MFTEVYLRQEIIKQNKLNSTFKYYWSKSATAQQQGQTCLCNVLCNGVISNMFVSE